MKSNIKTILTMVLSIFMLVCVLMGTAFAEDAPEALPKADINAGEGALYIEGFDTGAYVTKVIITLPEAVDAVSAEGALVTASGKERTVEAAYLSDAKGEEAAAPSQYITLKLNLVANNAVFHEVSDGFGNTLGTWVDEYVINARFTVEQAGEKKIAAMDANCIDNRILPVTEIFALDGIYTGTHTNPLTGEPETMNIRYAYSAPTALKEDGVKNPLIIWLHGSGEGGVNPIVPILKNEGAALAGEEIQSYFTTEGGAVGAYVLVPQCETIWMDRGDNVKYWGDLETRWTEALMYAVNQYLGENPDVDTNRIYIGGASNGGYMTINMMLHYPDVWAAAFPVCECFPYYVWQTNEDGTYVSGQPEKAFTPFPNMLFSRIVPTDERWMTDEKIEIIKDTPIWFIHSSSDTGVLPEYNSMPIYRALLRAGAENAWFSMPESVRTLDITEGRSAGHFVWQNVLNNYIRGVQDRDAIKNSADDDPTMGFIPNDDNLGGVASNGYDSLYAWLNSQVKE